MFCDSNLESLEESLEKFFSMNGTDGGECKIIIITSGGTTVNLDHFGIRFIDNFSTGTRGSEIAEFFLMNDYLVIFISRRNCNLPFLKSLFNNDKPYQLLDSFSVTNDSSFKFEPTEEFKSLVLRDLNSYKQYKSRLFLQYFTTLSEYRESLNVIIKCCNKFKENVAYCLVAAASDFKFSYDSLMKEKFSSKNVVNLVLEPLPKVRKMIREICGDYPMLCCFKMSTNESDGEKSSREMLLKPTAADMVQAHSTIYSRSSVTYSRKDSRT
ncbi:uncharacterized protein TA12810 [Theileria annulata]|uniref:Uncharacterized protein n=1 Tax=Theileria annulata TaxID=5874 RepID=Q4UE74_THEAN|nr:uncharacterized protein TA12810 [Theileria annulata]CAI74615.1 hypothetical protein, conserved [Theileria annulata]|eukprot:XP_952347.1 hypothetical protein, conserved [Theileria annulata]